MHPADGLAVVGKRLAAAGLLHRQARTVTGLSLREEIARRSPRASGAACRPMPAAVLVTFDRLAAEQLLVSIIR